jgi:hypothetical protein
MALLGLELGNRFIAAVNIFSLTVDISYSIRVRVRVRVRITVRIGVGGRVRKHQE